MSPNSDITPMIERTGMLSIQLMLLDKKECGFDELATLPIARGSLSKRLQELKKLGLIERRAEGKRKFYSLSNQGKRIAKDLRRYMDNAKVIADMTITRDHLFNDIIPKLNETLNSLVEIINIIDSDKPLSLPIEKLRQLNEENIKEVESTLKETKSVLEEYKKKLLAETEGEENPRMKKLLEKVTQRFEHAEELYTKAEAELGEIKKLSKKLK